MASGGPGGPGKFVHFDVAAELSVVSIYNDKAQGVCNKNTTVWKKWSCLYVSQDKEHFLTSVGAHVSHEK